MPVRAIVVCIVSIVLAAAVPYCMLRSRTEDPKLRLYNNLFRWLALDENLDSAGSKRLSGRAGRAKGNSL